jgi:hypothetical protein
MADQQDSIHAHGATDDKGIGEREKHHEITSENPASNAEISEKKPGLDTEVERAISYADDDNNDGYDVRKEDRYGEVTVIDNAKDLVTHVLHVDDNPDDSPWTFRAMAIGKFNSSVMNYIFINKDLSSRPHFVHLCIRVTGNLLLQAPSHLRVSGLSDSHRLHLGYTIYFHPTTDWQWYRSPSMSLSQSGRFQLQRARIHGDYGLCWLNICSSNADHCRPATLLRVKSEPRCCHLSRHRITVPFIWYRGAASYCPGSASQDAVADQYSRQYLVRDITPRQG